jgi:hypothetical protein
LPLQPTRYPWYSYLAPISTLINRDVTRGRGHGGPNTGGMSVALDQAHNLPKPRLPKSLGGEGRDAVFQLFARELPPALLVRQDCYPHACVEPVSRCALSLYESSLATTVRYWSKVHE